MKNAHNKNLMRFNVLDMLLAFIISIGAFLMASKNIGVTLALSVFIIIWTIFRLARYIRSVEKKLEEIRNRNLPSANAVK